MRTDVNRFYSYFEQVQETHIQELNTSNSLNERFPIFHISITPNRFWELFLIEYELINKKKFLVTNESKQFVFTVILYFLRDLRFYNSPLIFQFEQCEKSLNKGLLVVGGFGVGKTSILITICSLIDKLSLNSGILKVRMHNTLSIVEEFENSLSYERNDIVNKYCKGFRIFDDVKNEREASNYGKVDLFKDILYRRCESKNFRTILLCNYDSKFPNDMVKAIESFGRYGERNYDRLFEGFNFVEFKGTSNRK